MFALTQSVDEKAHAQFDEVAHGQVAFAKMIYPHLRPHFGWTDEFGDIDSEKVVSRSRVRFLFWASIFGPDLVRRIGKEFLLNAPGWKKEEQDDGSVLYVVDEHYSNWHARPSQAAIQYFQAKMPQIQPYRASAVSLPNAVARMVQIDDETGAETIVYQRPRTKSPRRKKS
jgi:hypothetical protein